MSTQAGLFDPVAETRAVLKQVEDNADTNWKAQALQALEQTCLKAETFISDDIWTLGELESTREDRALGPILLQAKRNGWCEKTSSMRPSRRSHLSGKPVWKSLLYRAGR